jgi:hypothetical protein
MASIAHESFEHALKGSPKHADFTAYKFQAAIQNTSMTKSSGRMTAARSFPSFT